jgi:hypothetical protein
MVIFRSTDGKPGYHQTEGLDEAVRFVERLRNTENVEQARIYKMDEVTFTYRPYYKVEVAATAGTSDAGTSDAGINEAEPAHLNPEPAPEPVAAAVDGGGDGDAALMPAPPVLASVGADDGGSADGDAAGANGRRGLFGR